MTGPGRLLVHHRAEGYVHRSIPDAVEAIVRIGADRALEVETTEDPDRFTRGDLAGFDALVFVHTSGDVLPEPGQRRALERYVTGGGGFLGIHAASSMGPVAGEWPWYRELIGAAFKGHTAARLYCDGPVEPSPGVVHAGPLAAAPLDAERIGASLAVTTWEPATVHVEDPGCPAVDGLTDGDTISDEWYGFDENPRGRVHVLATVDEATYEPHLGAMGEDHPVVWWRELGAGRSVYNSMGHGSAAWRDPRFLATVAGGIALASGAR